MSFWRKQKAIKDHIGGCEGEQSLMPNINSLACSPLHILPFLKRGTRCACLCVFGVEGGVSYPLPLVTSAPEDLAGSRIPLGGQTGSTSRNPAQALRHLGRAPTPIRVQRNLLSPFLM